MTWKLSFVLLCALACISSAENTRRKAAKNAQVWEPPTVAHFPPSVKSTVRKNMAAGLAVSRLQVVLEETELAAVQKRVGGTIGHRGDAGDSLSWLCLYGADPEGSWVLWLMSDEIDANTVSGFRWQQVSGSAQFDNRCQKLPDGRVGIELPGALRLGATEGKAMQALGQPSRRLGNALLYLHDPDKPIREMNTVLILLRGGVVRTIEVWKSSAN